MTFICHWQRSGRRVEPSVLDALDRGLTRLRSGPRVRKIVGPLTLLSFVDHDAISVSERVPGQSTVLVGRLDDVAGLTSRLGGHRGTSAASSGAELAEAALDRWGEAAVEMLLGDFLLLVWEAGPRTLRCYRDIVGGNPCYYWHADGEVLLAGHLGGVTAHPRVSRDPNPGYLAEVLADEVHATNETAFQNVFRLRAGHGASFGPQGQPVVRRWGSVCPRALRLGTPAAVDEEYRDIVAAAIRDRTRGPSEAAVELSGGLDSSTVAVLAGEQSISRWGLPTSSFSVIFPEVRAADETRYLRAVVEAAQLDGCEVVGGAVPADRISEGLQATADIPISPNSLSAQFLVPAVHESGKTALLTGVGGDECFYPSSIYPAALLRQGQLGRSWRAAGRASPGAPALSAFTSQSLRPSIGYAARQLRPTFRQRLPDWIDVGFARQVSLADRLAPSRPARTSEQARLRLLNSGHVSTVNEVTSLYGARSGVTFRHPLLDLRLLSFAAGLEEEHRWRDDCFRSIQRTALRGRLPELVRMRGDKAHFNHLFTNQFLVAGGRDRFANLLIAEEAGWVSKKRVLQMYDTYTADIASDGTSSHLWPLWSVLAVDSWFVWMTGAATC